MVKLKVVGFIIQKFESWDEGNWLFVVSLRISLLYFQFPSENVNLPKGYIFKLSEMEIRG